MTGRGSGEPSEAWVVNQASPGDDTCCWITIVRVPVGIGERNAFTSLQNKH